MPPFQQVSLSNFCPVRAAPVNCKCCYCEGEMSRSNTSRLSQAHRTGPQGAETRKNRLSSVATLTIEFQTASGSNVSTIIVKLLNFMKWVSMAEQLHTSLRSPCGMPSGGRSGVKLDTIRLCSRKMFYRDQSYHHVSSANLMMVLASCASTHLWVNREYRRGLSTHP